MPTLRETQRALAEAILNAATSGPAARLIVGDSLPTDARLRIYQNNFLMSLRGALQATYPTVQRLVGEGYFATLARHYVRVAPPRSGNLHDFGAELPAFLERYQPAAQLAYLGDVARIDWACHRAYHAADSGSFDFAALSRLPEQSYGRLRLLLQPAASLLASPYPVVRIWAVNRDGYQGDQGIDLRLGAQRALIARVRGQVVVEALPKGRFEFLRALQRGAVLEEALDAAVGAEPQFELNRELPHLVARQLIGGFAL